MQPPRVGGAPDAQPSATPDTRPQVAPARPRRRLGGALAVAAGILLSRIAGLARERAIAHYLGISAAADAFRAALRIPNLLQNLLGEGVLSASFIPVYARLLAEGRDSDAARVARTVGTLLALAASAVALAGILGASALVELLAPGFDDATRAWTVQLVQILFPGVALLVLSAWCLGVLNSHRKFFLSYASPVLWNGALIASVIVAARRFSGRDFELATWLAWGAVIGSAAQLAVQLPSVIRLLGSLRPSLALGDPGTRGVLRAFAPILLGRGSVQLSGYIDQVIASFLGQGVVAALANAQTLYLLPVSLFGMAVSASELPEMSRAGGDEALRAAHLKRRLSAALRQVVFLVVPSALAFLTLGDVIVSLLFQSGRFAARDTTLVWLLLAGSAIGLSAGTQGRLLASAFYALGDPRMPLRASLVRVAITALAGWALALPLRARLGYSAAWGAFALTASAGCAAWIEFSLLRRALAARIGELSLPTRLSLGALAAAALAGACARASAHGAQLLGAPAWLAAALALAAFGAVYLALMLLARVPEARSLIARVVPRRR